MAGNLLLATAGQRVLDRMIVPQAHRRWEAGALVWDAEDESDHIVFPYSGAAAVLAHIDGPLMVGTVGADGAIGLLEAGAPVRWNTTARAITSVEGWRLPRGQFEAAIADDAPFAATIENYIKLLTLEARQEVACRVRHRATAQVAGWLGHVFDLSDRDELHLTQHAIAEWFGVQRTTLNAIAKTLKTAGAIRYRRDKIRLADRQSLVRLGCDCRSSATEDRLNLGLPTQQIRTDLATANDDEVITRWSSTLTR